MDRAREDSGLGAQQMLATLQRGRLYGREFAETDEDLAELVKDFVLEDTRADRSDEGPVCMRLRVWQYCRRSMGLRAAQYKCLYWRMCLRVAVVLACRYVY